MRSLLIFAFALAIGSVEPHGYLKEPIARTSIQLRPEFNTQQPYWWDNQGVWCGNVAQDQSYSTCGRCGDNPGETHANQGGQYDKGVIVASYTAGSIIDVTANFQAPHHGVFTVELCPQVTESNTCFQLLNVVSATEQVNNNRVCVPYDNVNKDITARVQLPAGVRCTRCTLRWTYRTNYPGPADWACAKLTTGMLKPSGIVPILPSTKNSALAQTICFLYSSNTYILDLIS